MSRTIDFCRRLLPTGLCYLVFGLGCVLVYGLLWPIEILPLKRRRKQQLVRRLVRTLFRFFVRLIRATGVMSVEIEGAERLSSERSRLVVANHPTLVDVVVLVSLLPDSVCIVKAELEQSIVFRSVLRGTGYLTNASPEVLLEECARALEDGSSVILFPEGTRSVPGEPLKFMRGAAQIALRCCHDLTPVVITCHPPVLMKNQKWYEFAHHESVTMTLKVEPDIPVMDFILSDEGIPLASRKLTRHLTDYFHRRLHWPAELQREQ